MAYLFDCPQCKEPLQFLSLSIGDPFECCSCGHRGAVPEEAVYADSMRVARHPQQRSSSTIPAPATLTAEMDRAHVTIRVDTSSLRWRFIFLLALVFAIVISATILKAHVDISRPGDFSVYGATGLLLAYIGLPFLIARRLSHRLFMHGLLVGLVGWALCCPVLVYGITRDPYWGTDAYWGYAAGFMIMLIYVIIGMITSPLIGVLAEFLGFLKK